MTESARPLVVRFGALGDMVLLTVAIRLLHRRFGVPVDILGSGEWTRPLLAGQPGVGEIYLLRSRHRPFWLGPDQWWLVRQLQRRGAGATWLFDPDNDKTRWLLQQAGWLPQHFLTPEQMPQVSGEPFCDRWRRFAQLVPAAAAGAGCSVVEGRDAADATPGLQVTAQARAGLAALLARRGLAERPLILVQVGNKRTMHLGRRQRASNTKYWPEEHWATVLRTLRGLHPRHALLLLGVAREARMNAEILALAGTEDAHNLAGALSMPDLMALAERAFGMLSVDTGPAHLCAAVGCPVLALYASPVAERIYAVRGPGVPTRRLTGGTDAAPSLLGLTPAQVMEAWGGLAEEVQAGEAGKGG
jgi:heptosyltransferase-2/heptosyltransferase-3